MLSDPDPRRQLVLHATNARHIHERSADVAEIVRGAAIADPEIAAMLGHARPCSAMLGHARPCSAMLASARLADARTVARSLAEKRALAAGVTVERAAALLWALCSHDLYRMLVIEQHWPPEDYEHWLATSLIHSLLDPWAPQ